MPRKKTISSNKKKKAKPAKAKPSLQAVTGDGGRSQSPPVVVPDQLSCAEEEFMDALVEKLWPNCVPASMSSDAKLLKTYLERVLFGVAAQSQASQTLQSINAFLKKALYSGYMAARLAISPDTEPFTVLIWVCQWKSLRKQVGFRGDDDLVEIVLKRGADVNDRLSNGTHALFSAVKYGTIRTVDLLLNAGIDIRAVDHLGRTCLKNAVEHPQPDILERLLQTLPATEMLACDPVRSLADTLLFNFMGDAERGEIPISWHSLGRPSVDNIAHALMILLRKGSQFTDPTTLSLAYSVSSKELKIIMSFLLGKWLPVPLQQEVVEFDLKAFSLREDDCAICHSKDDDGEKPREKIELYCGHCFCLDCIVNYGKRQTSRAGCPTCRRPLCLELCSTIPSGRCSAMELLRSRNMETVLPVGPFAMNEDQVLRECCARSIPAAGKSIDELRRKLVVPVSTTVEAELCATKSISNGTHTVIAPKDGLVVIPIVIKSIPVLALVSLRTPFTVVSRKFVTTYGLKKKMLTTDRFIDFVGRRYKNSVFTALHEFEIAIGGISVQLNSAVEMFEMPEFEFGIQLGIDFLMSAAYCVFDIEIATVDRTFMRLDNCGGFERIPNIAASAKEEMRYYAKTGESFASKVLKLKHLNEDVVLTCALHEKESLDECHWCCKLFPYGMRKCPKCPEALLYCDKECLTKAWPIHRLRPAHSNSKRK